MMKKHKKLAAFIVLIIPILVFVPTLTAIALNYQKPDIIVIDPGHGGYDGGVKGLTSGIKESTINLEIANLVKGYLESDGYRVVMTRTEDIALGNTKRSDMKKRIELINASNCLLAVSIHVNFYPSSYRRGIQTFFNKNIDESLAKTLQETLNSALNIPTIERGFSSLWGDYYILSKSKCPATIIETGFISNSQDEKQLLSKEYRMILAFHIYNGIKKYIANTVPSSDDFTGQNV